MFFILLLFLLEQKFMLQNISSFKAASYFDINTSLLIMVRTKHVMIQDNGILI
jgi:hypothetical protein